MQTVVLERFQAVGVFCVHDLEVYCVELFPESARSDNVSLNKNLFCFPVWELKRAIPAPVQEFVCNS